MFIFFLVRKWAAFFLIQALQAVGKASFLRQARLLRMHSGSWDSATRRLDRDTRMTALLDRAMETVFFRDRLVQAG
ncbi:MAG: hypothetical protein DWI26_02150, partial [Planctomycetota bacterium]